MLGEFSSGGPGNGSGTETSERQQGEGDVITDLDAYYATVDGDGGVGDGVTQTGDGFGDDVGSGDGVKGNGAAGLEPRHVKFL